MTGTSIDLEAQLAGYLYERGRPHQWRVYGGELEPAFEQAGLPAVRVIELPGREASRAWNGPGLLYEVDVDVDVFDTDEDRLADTAAQVRDYLHQYRSTAVQVTAAPAFTRRPEWNDKVRRRGAVLSLVTRYKEHTP